MYGRTQTYSAPHFVFCFVVTPWLGNVTAVVVVGVCLNDLN